MRISLSCDLTTERSKFNSNNAEDKIKREVLQSQLSSVALAGVEPAKLGGAG